MEEEKETEEMEKEPVKEVEEMEDKKEMEEEEMEKEMEEEEMEMEEKGEEEEMEEDGMYQDSGAAHTQLCTSVIYVFSSSQRRPPVRANPDASLTQPLRRRRWAAEVSPWRDRGVCLFGSNDVCSSTSLQDTVSLFPLYFAAPPTSWLRP